MNFDIHRVAEEIRDLLEPLDERARESVEYLISEWFCSHCWRELREDERCHCWNDE
jgi:hypothetical protein